MQFKRMLVLMLILFTALDLFLYMFWQRGFTASVDVNAPSSDIIQEMKKQKIALPKISDKTYTASYMAARVDTDLSNQARQYNGMITYNIKNDALNLTFKSDNRTGLEGNDGYIRANIEKWGYQLNRLLTQSVDDRAGHSYVAYSQIVFGLPVIAKQGQLEIDYDRPNRLGNVVQRHINDVERLNQKDDTISEQAAIEALYRYNALNSGDRLSSGQLSYEVADHYGGKDIYEPVWLFLNTDKRGNKTLLEINAFTGEQVT